MGSGQGGLCVSRSALLEVGPGQFKRDLWVVSETPIEGIGVAGNCRLRTATDAVANKGERLLLDIHEFLHELKVDHTPTSRGDAN